MSINPPDRRPTSSAKRTASAVGIPATAISSAIGSVSPSPPDLSPNASLLHAVNATARQVT